ncbi:MAG: hypothetical protein PHQ64_01255 [Bacilli bacterium]|nr:hypothetical protein [Bacilli bacterium]
MKKTIDCLIKDKKNLVRNTYSYQEEDLIFIFNKEDPLNKYFRLMLENNEINFTSLYSFLLVDDSINTKDVIINKIINFLSIFNYETKKIIILSEEDKKLQSHIIEDKKATINKLVIDLIEEKTILNKIIK